MIYLLATLFLSACYGEETVGGRGHTVDYTLLKSGHECQSSDSLVGSDLTLEECAKKAGDRGSARHGWAQYFIFGTGSKSGWCYVEYTKGDWCPEGWESDDYDFYKLTHHWSTEDAVGEGMVDYAAVKRIKWEYAQKGCLPKPYKSHGEGYSVYNCAKKCRNDHSCKQFSMKGSKCWTTSKDYIVKCGGWFSSDEDVYRILAADEDAVGEGMVDYAAVKRIKWEYAQKGCLPKPYKSHGEGYSVYNCAKKCRNDPSCKQFSMKGSKCWTTSNDYIVKCGGWFSSDEDVYRILAADEAEVASFASGPYVARCRRGRVWSEARQRCVRSFSANTMRRADSHVSVMEALTKGLAAFGLAVTLFGAYRHFTSK